MAEFTQSDHSISVSTPLEDDVLMLSGFSGHEAISQLFSFELDLLAENKADVAFDKLLGEKITISLQLPDEKTRFFNGICCRFTQGARAARFTQYRAQIVPQFWLLTRTFQSRVFQHLSVPDILKNVLSKLDVSYEIQGNFDQRDYCVQYRESDFNFASRLMEEEGIYYYFKHSSNGHKMVLANTPQSHKDLPDFSRLIYEEVAGGIREEDRISSWIKSQELRSGKLVLWDHSFELPGKHLEAERPILDSVQIGKVTHKLKLGGNDKFEIYRYPGEYAQRYDGIDRSGGESPAELQKIFQDNKRTVEIRMQEEELQSIIISGTSNCRQLSSGHKFTLERHFNADGQYVLTQVNHSAKIGNAVSGMQEFEYSNQFECLPFALPFKPIRISPKPMIHGTQTAVAVGPSGEEIYTDKYGRVKVQFHWDREGKFNADSSCWVRVSTSWAGRQWGTIHLPRIGQEVVVAFEEGDPDQPLIVGSVYNADMMPPYNLPGKKMVSTTKSDSTLGHGGFNELRFNDDKGKEQIYLHAQKDLHVRVKNDRVEEIENDCHLTIDRDNQIHIKRDQHVTIDRDLLEKVTGDHSLKIQGKETVEIVGSHSCKVTGNIQGKCDSDNIQEVSGTVKIKADKIILEAASGISLKVGGSFIVVDSSGVTIKGSIIKLNSGGSALSGDSKGPLAPTDPKKPILPVDSV